MSFALETLVRPFQSPSVVGTRRIVSTRSAVVVEPVNVCWGEAGDMPTAVEVPPGEDPLVVNFEVKKRAEHNLIKLETEKVRIQNPDDPDQYLITERIKKATFKEKNVDAVSAYPKGSTATATQTMPGAAPASGWQPGETQVNTDGTGPGSQTYPLKIEERDYHIEWPPGENETPV